MAYLLAYFILSEVHDGQEPRLCLPHLWASPLHHSAVLKQVCELQPTSQILPATCIHTAHGLRMAPDVFNG